MTNISSSLRRGFILAALMALTACTYGRVDLGGGKYSQAAAIKGQGGSYKVGTLTKLWGPGIIRRKITLILKLA